MIAFLSSDDFSRKFDELSSKNLIKALITGTDRVWRSFWRLVVRKYFTSRNSKLK